jgi:ribose 5-phosphate isomerase B
MSWLDLGADSTDSVDYPDYASKLAAVIKDCRATHGVLICGSGVGISIAANRYQHIRCALVFNTEMAKLSRQHNDANVLALGARFVTPDDAVACVETFLNTAFEGGRHQKRVDKINNC